jgi:hypothetical protein
MSLNTYEYTHIYTIVGFSVYVATRFFDRLDKEYKQLQPGISINRHIYICIQI